jgi:hypothetical protein
MSDPEYIARLVHLDDLTIRGCRNVGGIFTPALADAKSVTPKQPFALVSKLRLGSCTWHGFDGIHLLTGLETLVLYDVSVQAPPKGVDMSILSPLSMLTHLDLLEKPDSRAMPITDHTMSSLASLEHLTNLALANCSITDAGLATLSSLSTLTHLFLYNCKHATGEGLCAPSNVRHLTLSNIPIRTKTFVAIGKLPSVTSLYLVKNKLPPAAAVQALRHLKLVQIDLTECTGVTLEFMLAVRMTFKHHLRHFKLDDDKLDILNKFTAFIMHPH